MSLTLVGCSYPLLFLCQAIVDTWLTYFQGPARVTSLVKTHNVKFRLVGPSQRSLNKKTQTCKVLAFATPHYWTNMNRQDPADSVAPTFTDDATSDVPVGNDTHSEKVLDRVLESASAVDKSEEAWDNLEDDWENDPDNARNWPKGKKWTAVAVVRTMAFYHSVVNFFDRFPRILLYRLSLAL